MPCNQLSVRKLQDGSYKAVLATDTQSIDPLVVRCWRSPERQSTSNDSLSHPLAYEDSSGVGESSHHR